MRVWLLANRAERDDDPVTLAVKDPQSLALAALLGLAFALFGPPSSFDTFSLWRMMITAASGANRAKLTEVVGDGATGSTAAIANLLVCYLPVFIVPFETAFILTSTGCMAVAFPLVQKITFGSPDMPLPRRVVRFTEVDPFVQGGGSPESVAIGLRNPVLASVDPVSGDVLIGDGGEGAIKEFDRIAAGAAGPQSPGQALSSWKDLAL